MNFQIDRHYINQEIKIPIRTYGKTRIVCRVHNKTKPYTRYFDTAPFITGYDNFIIKIPKMPPSVVVEIYNEANGNTANDNTFQVGKISVSEIKLGWQISRIMDSTVSSFAKFSDDFAENAGILSAQNSIYMSPCGRFRIDYKDVIRDDKGAELRTPARINSKTGVIEISKKYYRNYTVPGRKALNWHEFSHVFRNVNKSDEIEADKNAIMIYLGTGNPTVEAYNVFLKVFKNSPHNLNRKRYDEINKFIRTFSQKVNQTGTKI